MSIMRNVFGAVAAAVFLALPLAGSGQTMPSYAAPTPGGDAQIHGRIVSFDGGYNLQVRDDK